MKNKKEIILYLLFGGLTTVVNIAIYYLMADLFHLDYRLATTIAWVGAVLFAYITNKRYVFTSRQSFLTEFFSFIGARLLSYGLDISTMIILVEMLAFNDLLSKVIANILVIVFNYVASKYFIFQSKSEGSSHDH